MTLSLSDDVGTEAVCDAAGCLPRTQPVPGDEMEREAFLRQIGWRSDAEGKHTCPFCAGGANLEKLRAIFEGRGKESLS